MLGAAWVSGDVGFGLLLSPSEAAPLGLPRLPAAGIRAAWAGLGEGQKQARTQGTLRTRPGSQ